jgi:hypothetical protein
MRDTESLIRDAEDIGRKNAETIQLAQAWCGRIRRDRGHMGVGIVEQQTGLPVSGGTFRCDFARNSGAEGMNLAQIAFDFYERNCATCKDRAPTGIVPNLGTWAEQIVEKRREADERNAEALKTREAVRVERHRRRRLKAGQLSAVAQSTIDLLEKLDAETPDRNASTDLLALAQLHPDGFTPDLLNVVLSDAEELRSEACLEVVITIRQGRGLDLAEVLPIALKALREGWGFDVSASLAAAHATAADVDSDLFRAAVLRASSPIPFLTNRQPKPDLLSRLFVVAPELCTTLLIAQVLADDDGRRAGAAQAASYLFDSGALQPTETLVDCLLNASRRMDQIRLRHVEASSAVQGAVASAMHRNPGLVESLIDSRWDGAPARDRLSFLECYDDVVRSNLGKELPPEIPTAIARRTLSCLTDTDPEVISKAADLLDLVFGYHARVAHIPIDVVLGALALASRAYDCTPPSDSRIIPVGGEHPLVSSLEREERRSALCVATRSLTSAVGALAPLQRSAFWSGVDLLWSTDVHDSPTLKAQLTSVLGKVARESDSLVRALPYLYSALLGSEQLVRAHAIAAFTELLQGEFKGEAFPEAVTLGLIAGLSDQYLIVIAEACAAVRYLSIRSDELVAVLNRLLAIASKYATQPRFEAMILDAVGSASSLARATEYRTAVDRAVLRIVDSMQPYYALKILSSMPTLSDQPQWAASAIRALRPNTDRAYEDLLDDDKNRLMCKIASLAPERVAPHVAELLDTALKAIPAQPYKAWRIADLLSSMSFHAAAAEIAEKALASIRETPANASIRSQTAALRACFMVEAAAARGDAAALMQALDDWRKAEAALKKAEEEKDARPFWATFIPE